MFLIVIGGIAFAVLKPVKVLPRMRPAPGYALTAPDGSMVTSEDARGSITLYTFMPLDCGEACDEVVSTMQEVHDRVADEVDFDGAPFQMVTIVLDPDPDLAAVAAAAAEANAGDDWLWLTGTESQVRNVAGHGFRVRSAADDASFSASYTIVDGFGTVRGEYRYRTLSDDADKLVRHLDVLGSELRNASGFASLAYDAAHLFQCYP